MTPNKFVKVGLTRDKPKSGARVNGWLVPELIEGIASLNEPREGLANSFHPSSTPMCPRAGVLKRTFPRPMSDTSKNELASSVLYTELGNTAHEIVYKALESMGVLVHNELKVSVPEIDLSGYIDNIVSSLINKELMIIDVKTISKIPSKPKTDYVKQIHSYSLATGIDNLVILYLDRTVGYPKPKIKAFDVFEQEVLEQVALSFSLAKVAYDNQVYPERVNKRHCKFCEYKPVCWDVDMLVDKPMTIGHIKQAKRLAKHVLERRKSIEL